MKLVTYVASEGHRRAGIALEERVIDLADGAAEIGETLPDDVVTFLSWGEEGAAIARRVVAAAQAGTIAGLPVSDVRLGAALTNPPAIYLLAGNYQSHIVEAGHAPVDKTRINPRPFLKPITAVIGPDDPILIPPDSETLDYEIEIAAVIGKPGRQIALHDAESHVAGYVVFNDVSARSLKVAENRIERNGDWFFDWLLGKWCDSFAAIGPYLVTRDEVADPGALELALHVNGELRQHSSAGEMIFTIPETIAFLSRFVTLQPGMLLCMGTPGGVGATTATYLKAGDVISARIEGLGTLTNTVQ